MPTSTQQPNAQSSSVRSREPTAENAGEKGLLAGAVSTHADTSNKENEETTLVTPPPTSSNFLDSVLENVKGQDLASKFISIKTAYKQSKEKSQTEASDKDKEKVARIAKKAQRDKEANIRGCPPVTKENRKLRKKQSKSTTVVKPHPHFTPKKRPLPLQNTPSAPKKKRIVTPNPGDFVPRVSENTSDSTGSLTTCTDEHEDPAEFVCHRTAGIAALLQEDEFALFHLDSFQEDGTTMAKKNQALEAAKKKLKELEEEKQDLLVQMETQGMTVMRLSTENEELRKAFDNEDKFKSAGEWKDQVKKNAEELGKVSAEVHTLSKENKKYEKTEVAMFKEIQDLKKQVASTISGKKPSAGDDPKIGELTQEVERLRGLNKKESDKHDKVHAKYEELKTNAKKKIKKQTKDIDDLKAQINLLETQQEDLAGTPLGGKPPVNKEQEKEITSLKRDKKALSTEVLSLKGEVESYKKGKAKQDEDFEEANKLLDSLKRELDSLKRELRQKTREASAPSTENDPNTLNEEASDRGKSKAQLLKEITKLKASNQSLTESLKKCKMALKDGGKYAKGEKSKNVEAKIKSWIKKVTFHRNKFVCSDADMKEICQGVYDGIKDDPELLWSSEDKPFPFDEFYRIYRDSCRTELNGRRQYAQTNCFKAAVEFQKQFGRTLTLKDIKDITVIPDADKDVEKYSQKVKIVLWYFDYWLPACAGIEHYGPKRRHYKKATKATIVIEARLAPKRDGIQVPLVPIAAEAWGLTILENCEEKWKHLTPLKAANPKHPIPRFMKDDPDTHKYHATKWSDSTSTSGQSENGGWKAAGVSAFGAYTKEIEAFRDMDRKKSKDKKSKDKTSDKTSFYELGLQLMRDHNNVTTDVYNERPNKKKRKGAALESELPKIPKVVDVYSDDEDDDQFSVRSEGSAE